MVIGHDPRRPVSNDDMPLMGVAMIAKLWFFLGYSQPFIHAKDLVYLIFGLGHFMEGKLARTA